MAFIEKEKSKERPLKNKEQFPVKLGEIVFTNDPEYYNLLGIGTCLGIYIFDLVKRRYIIAHAVLPYYQEIQKEFDSEMPARFTDIAISLMIKRILKSGSKRSDLKAKIVGGSQIFSDNLKIGKKNILSATETFEKENVSLVGQDVGGTQGRSIYSFNSDGTIVIRQKGNYYTI